MVTALDIWYCCAGLTVLPDFLSSNGHHGSAGIPGDTWHDCAALNVCTDSSLIQSMAVRVYLVIYIKAVREYLVIYRKAVQL